MQEKDIKQIAELEKRIFSIPWSVATLEKSFAKDNYIFIVAAKEDLIIGYAGMYIVKTEGNITNIAVAKEYRRQKIATDLLIELIGYAKGRGVQDMVLEVRCSNHNAIALYSQFGFINRGVRKDFYKQPTEDGIIMWKYNI